MMLRQVKVPCSRAHNNVMDLLVARGHNFKWISKVLVGEDLYKFSLSASTIREDFWQVSFLWLMTEVS